MSVICEDSVYRLTKPETLITEIGRLLKRTSCEVTEDSEALVARCGDCLVVARAEWLGHENLVRDLGTIGELASVVGTGEVRLRVEVSEGCGKICEEIKWRALMKGGG